LQIGSVFPHFTEKELKLRTSEWAKVFDIDSFYMDQPFTKTGQAHATSHEDQWIRRQIYKTEYAFPFLLKRIQIIRTSEQELSPIENAIIAITDKLNTFNSELNSSNPRIKILQRDLQGTLLLQVNAGPMALVITFLSEENKAKYKEEHRNLLADRFHQFIRTLHHSVVLNGSLKGTLKSDEGQQQLLQDTLEEQLKLMTEKLKEFPIFSQRTLALANERVKQDNLISQQISRTLNYDVSEIGVENIRTRRDSKNSSHYNTLSNPSLSPSDSPLKSPSVKSKASDDSGIKDKGRALASRKSRENRRSLVNPKSSSESLTPERSSSSRPSTPKKEDLSADGLTITTPGKRMKEKRLSNELIQSSSSPSMSISPSLRAKSMANKTKDEITSNSNEISAKTKLSHTSKSHDILATSPSRTSTSHSSTPSNNEMMITQKESSELKNKSPEDERLVTIRAAVKKMCEELKLQLQGLLTPDENDVNKLFPLLKLYKSITLEIKRINEVLPLKDYSTPPPTALSQNRVLLVKHLIDKENEQIQLMLCEVESSIINISDANVFKSVIHILRDVIVLLKDK